MSKQTASKHAVFCDSTHSPFEEGVALVIGGSGGMGSVICQHFAARGCDIALTYRHNQTRAEDVAQAIRAKGKQASVHGMDIADETSVATAIAAITATQRIHTIIVASGSDIDQRRIADLTPEMWRSVLDADSNGFFNVIHHTLPHLRAAGGGSYVHLSTCGMQRWPDGDALSVAPKACNDALLRGIAREEGRHKIRANAIAVGVIESGIFLRLKEQGHFDERWHQAVQRNLCLKRYGQPEEVAEAAWYLATANYVTGQTIAVSGGYGI